MNPEKLECWLTICALTLASILLSVVVIKVINLPPRVIVNSGFLEAERYTIPKEYKYSSSNICITGDVAVVTATFKRVSTKEAK